MRHKGSGFTLIELLVVISIIALLLAIMMPALGMVKEKAKSLVCRTNLKTLGLASRLYAEEHNGKMPEQYYYNDAGNFAGYRVWVRQLAPYAAEVDEARYCPSAKVKPKPSDVDLQGAVTGNSRKSWMFKYGDTLDDCEYGCYGLNGWFYSDKEGPNYYKKLGSVKQASSVPLYADAKFVDAWPDDDHYVPEDYDLGGDFWDPYGDTTGNMIRFIMDRHGKRTNLVFADGHAESVALSEMWSLRWHKNFDTQHDVKRGENHDGSPIYQKR
ncbi:type II secretion system protein G [Anaerohalosphaera lusitana]|uniref:Type II secretion system protein G n=1 Tax=Anaerohalosphaera lusitana TaxID=1936003 RepID=A0A1U9NI64_9BACT|nr:prepilin-type N-terminal cleavage/methylation domain-containing protein [Anaerohalosphaera lusitana]AQT67290.1 type II secretion system protein G [Anaerohalosphaera lusitana]